MQHRIIIGDCKDALKSIKSNSVDMIITSPPYNMGKSYDGSYDNKAKDELITFTQTWIKESARVLNCSGSLCINLPANDKQKLSELHKTYLPKARIVTQF